MTEEDSPPQLIVPQAGIVRISRVLVARPSWRAGRRPTIPETAIHFRLMAICRPATFDGAALDGEYGRVA